MTDAATKPTKSNAEIVLSAVQDLFAREQIVTREILSELTGLKLTTIDDRLGHLVDTGKIRRVQRGARPGGGDLRYSIGPIGEVRLDWGFLISVWTGWERGGR